MPVEPGWFIAMTLFSSSLAGFSFSRQIADETHLLYGDFPTGNSLSQDAAHERHVDLSSRDHHFSSNQLKNCFLLSKNNNYIILF